jgi:hypothetical protein
MEALFRVVLFLGGLIHLLPFSLAFLPQRIGSAYGVEVTGPDMMLLLRHRAVLFGIVGAVMLYSSLKKRYYVPATFAGLASMLSFILLYGIIGRVNESLRSVMWVDVAASVALASSAAVFLFRSGSRG